MSAVLVVDDQPPVREFLVRWLGPAGYETAQAPDAEAALSLLAERSFDVVLCDVQMPGRGGLWLVDQLRDKFPGVAIVLATGDSTVPPVVSMQSGVVDYVVKPFVRERVLDAVSRAVEWAKHAPAERNRRPGDDPLNEWLNKGRT
jgi:DNA-binding NtrC family response regulator